ncbi:ABC-type branched-chain amino acid transport system, permease component [Halovivax ruber XH-70]|uniref:ABC-type branched-chain amino acid transport system, permease component n=1 Tax=Halovivax ruber (strain DSM 18193 / JCM 13892 / XH-70) TaxID=797302 RepID=L0IEJ9_HALRX|nr:branched-chain amino acid ABC transporter permease [Halovivax ruber]AGB16651.1 ABC-type branched-chain amino acid transport system, permease component [Halovivax ruber XH-70]
MTDSTNDGTGRTATTDRSTTDSESTRTTPTGEVERLTPEGDSSPADAAADEADSWLHLYARDHLSHAAVVALFVVYPLLYAQLTAIPAIDLVVATVDPGAFFDAFLPATTFVIALFFLGLFAMSFDFISGYTGYLSFGHAAFYGVGAYGIILAANGKVPGLSPETPFMVTMILAGLVAFALALAIGLVSFRLSGVYFAMITLGVAQVIYVLVRNWDYAAGNPLSGPSHNGPTPEIGIPYVDSLSVAIGRLAGDSFENVFGLGLDLSATWVSYWAIGLVVLVCYFAMQRIIHSPFGRVMIAIRENEERARAVGYNVFWYKMVAFGFSAFFAAIAGALFAGFSNNASPDDTFYFLVTADALIVTIIGGIGTLAGPLFGAGFFQWLEDVLSAEQGGLAPYLRETLGEPILSTEVLGVTLGDVINSAVAGRAPLYLGIVFVAFVLLVPNGLLGSLRDRLGGTVAKRLPAVLERYRRR